jgi:hypothetical protein
MPDDDICARVHEQLAELIFVIPHLNAGSRAYTSLSVTGYTYGTIISKCTWRRSPSLAPSPAWQG